MIFKWFLIKKASRPLSVRTCREGVGEAEDSRRLAVPWHARAGVQAPCGSPRACPTAKWDGDALGQMHLDFEHLVGKQ